MAEHFVGIDPGFTGAVADISVDGSRVRVWDMPTRVRGDAKKYRAYDLKKAWHVLREARFGGPCVFGLENPTSRPGDGAERMMRFGRGIGNIEALILALTGEEPELVSPALWKGRLGLKGKEADENSELGVALFKRYYPKHEAVLYGARGGLKDGRLDALLIAHWLRVRTGDGMRSIVAEHGKQSPQALALVFSGGRKKRKKKI